MGSYDEYEGVQLKTGPCELLSYKIGDTVAIEDGIHIGFEGAVVIYEGRLVAMVKKIYDKWGEEITLDISDRNPLAKVLQLEIPEEPLCVQCGWAMGEREGKPLCPKCGPDKKQGLPERYIPSVLSMEEERIPREVAYGIGQEQQYFNPDKTLRNVEYGMWEGPNPDLMRMLEVVGKDKYSVVIRFNENWTEDVLYRWSEDEDCWIRGEQ